MQMVAANPREKSKAFIRRIYNSDILKTFKIKNLGYTNHVISNQSNKIEHRVAVLNLFPPGQQNMYD